MGAVRGTLSKQPHILTTHNNPTMKSLVLLIALAITAVAAGVHEGDFQEDTTPNSDFAHGVFEDLRTWTKMRTWKRMMIIMNMKMFLLTFQRIMTMTLICCRWRTRLKKTINETSKKINTCYGTQKELKAEKNKKKKKKKPLTQKKKKKKKKKKVPALIPLL